MKRNWSFSAGAAALVVLAACSQDRTTGPAGQAAFQRYAAIGTSLSMGVQSDGVVYFSQQHDWTKLLSHQALASFSQPLVAPPGCFSADRSASVQSSPEWDQRQRESSNQHSGYYVCVVRHDYAADQRCCD